jgi:hypothetical protein
MMRADDVAAVIDKLAPSRRGITDIQ